MTADQGRDFKTAELTPGDEFFMRVRILPAIVLWMALSSTMTAQDAGTKSPFQFDPVVSYRVEFPASSPVGESSIREHAICWHPVRQKYYLVADVVSLASSHHPNTYDTEIHLWSSETLADWRYHGIAIKKGIPGQAYDAYGTATPAGMVFRSGKLYVPFSARRTPKFDQRGIGLAWSEENPEQLPWSKSDRPISDLDGNDDDAALVELPDDDKLHLYHRYAGSDGYRIVHTASAHPQKPGSWPSAQPITSRPETVRAQELSAAFAIDGTIHLLVIEHLKSGGVKIAHLSSVEADGPFLPADPANRYLPPESQPANLAYSGMITPVVRENQLEALFWTVHQRGDRYGLLGHPAQMADEQSSRK